MGKNATKMGRGLFRSCKKPGQTTVVGKELKTVHRTSVSQVNGKSTVIRVPKGKKKARAKLFKDTCEFKGKIRTF